MGKFLFGSLALSVGIAGFSSFGGTSTAMNPAAVARMAKKQAQQRVLFVHNDDAAEAERTWQLQQTASKADEK